jgi:hypothetical protein
MESGTSGEARETLTRMIREMQLKPEGYALYAAGLLMSFLACAARMAVRRETEETARRHEQIGQVVEGVPNTLSTFQMARSLGVRTPITDAMYDILYNGKHPSDALKELMVRDLREENVTE